MRRPPRLIATVLMRLRCREAARGDEGLSTMNGTTREPQPRGTGTGLYLRLLTWSFALFNSVRVAAYLPTAWALQQSGDSNQHSLWTWLAWFGANLTTAAWLYEVDGQRLGRVAMVSACNAAMCLSVSVLIAWYRL